MTEQHPITPPPELFKQWEDDILNKRDNVDHVLDCAWKDGFRAGADQELEACCEWFVRDWTDIETAEKLRAARRPKPSSLKEQALALVEQHEDTWPPSPKDWDTIRRALEQLPND